MYYIQMIRKDIEEVCFMKNCEYKLKKDAIKACKILNEFARKEDDSLYNFTPIRITKKFRKSLFKNVSR